MPKIVGTTTQTQPRDFSAPKSTITKKRKRGSVFSAVASRVKKQERQEQPMMQFDYAKYDVRKADSRIGVSFRKVNKHLNLAEDKECKGAYVFTEELRMEGALTLTVSKGCLVARDIFLQAFRAVLIDATISEIYQTSLEALASITLKSPEINLTGIRIGGRERSKPSVTIIGNTINILGSTLDVAELKIKGLDTTSDSRLSISRSEVLFTSVSVEMSTTNFAETSFQHRNLNLAGKPEVKQRSITLRRGSSQNLQQTSRRSREIHLEASRLYCRNVEIKPLDPNYQPSIAIQSNSVKFVDSQVDIGHASIMDDGGSPDTICSFIKSKPHQPSYFRAQTLKLSYCVLGIMSTLIRCEDLSSGSIEIKRATLIDIQGANEDSDIEAFAQKVDFLISESDCTLLVDEQQYEIRDFQRSDFRPISLSKQVDGLRRAARVETQA